MANPCAINEIDIALYRSGKIFIGDDRATVYDLVEALQIVVNSILIRQPLSYYSFDEGRMAGFGQPVTAIKSKPNVCLEYVFSQINEFRFSLIEVSYEDTIKLLTELITAILKNPDVGRWKVQL